MKPLCFFKLEVGMLKIPNSTQKNNNQLGVGRSPGKKCVATKWHLEERNPEDSSWLVVSIHLKSISQIGHLPQILG